MSLYRCDPNKNTLCKKTACFINGGPCSHTTQESCALDSCLECVYIDKSTKSGLGYKCNRKKEIKRNLKYKNDKSKICEHFKRIDREPEIIRQMEKESADCRECKTEHDCYECGKYKENEE